MEVYLFLCCLCFPVQKFSPASWTSPEVLFCIDDSFGEDGCDFFQVVPSVEYSLHEKVHFFVYICFFRAKLMNSKYHAIDQSSEDSW